MRYEPFHRVLLHEVHFPAGCEKVDNIAQLLDGLAENKGFFGRQLQRDQ